MRRTPVDKRRGAKAELPDRATATAPTAGAERRPDGPQLGETLVAGGVIAPSQLNEALLQQPTSGKRIGTLLVELGALSERKLAEMLSPHLGVQVVDLRQEQPEPAVVSLLPEATARALTAIPIRDHAGKLEVAVADPLDGKVLSELAASTGKSVRLLLAAPSDIVRAIDNSYRALTDVDDLIETFQTTEALRRETEELPRSASDEAPVVRVVSLILTQALRDRSSDVHIEPQEDRVRVRFRIDGALHDVVALPAKMGPAVISRLKIMAGMNIVERRRSQDGQIVTEVDGRPVDVRVNTSPTIWGEKAVLRILDRSRSLHRLDDLGMPDATHAAFGRLVRSPFGMVVCAGPTGSGKTTTLYATLAEINQSEANITTIEDPVEYVFPSINQIQINEQAGITFANGLRAILRQDPDIILVGEIRDVETARIAVQSALTGHLVLSSIHATDAPSALLRFVDMGIEPYLIASSVIGVVSQRLVRRICEHCRVEYMPPVEELAFYHEAGGPEKLEFTQGEGCNFCARTGYQSRIGVYELLPVSDEVKQHLVIRSSHDEIRDVMINRGVRSLLDEGLRLVADDVTTIAEIMRSIYST
ncbi:MAG: type pilus assembly protein PilB [Actinomycetota bacterium]